MSRDYKREYQLRNERALAKTGKTYGANRYSSEKKTSKTPKRSNRSPHNLLTVAEQNKIIAQAQRTVLFYTNSKKRYRYQRKLFDYKTYPYFQKIKSKLTSSQVRQLRATYAVLKAFNYLENYEAIQQNQVKSKANTKKFYSIINNIKKIVEKSNVSWNDLTEYNNILLFSFLSYNEGTRTSINYLIFLLPSFILDDQDVAMGAINSEELIYYGAAS